MFTCKEVFDGFLFMGVAAQWCLPDCYISSPPFWMENLILFAFIFICVLPVLLYNTLEQNNDVEYKTSEESQENAEQVKQDHIVEAGNETEPHFIYSTTSSSSSSSFVEFISADTISYSRFSDMTLLAKHKNKHGKNKLLRKKTMTKCKNNKPNLMVSSSLSDSQLLKLVTNKYKNTNYIKQNTLLRRSLSSLHSIKPKQHSSCQSYDKTYSVCERSRDDFSLNSEYNFSNGSHTYNSDKFNVSSSFDKNCVNCERESKMNNKEEIRLFTSKNDIISKQKFDNDKLMLESVETILIERIHHYPVKPELLKWLRDSGHYLEKLNFKKGLGNDNSAKLEEIMFSDYDIEREESYKQFQVKKGDTFNSEYSGYSYDIDASSSNTYTIYNSTSTESLVTKDSYKSDVTCKVIWKSTENRIQKTERHKKNIHLTCSTTSFTLTSYPSDLSSVFDLDTEIRNVESFNTETGKRKEWNENETLHLRNKNNVRNMDFDITLKNISTTSNKTGTENYGSGNNKHVKLRKTLSTCDFSSSYLKDISNTIQVTSQDGAKISKTGYESFTCETKIQSKTSKTYDDSEKEIKDSRKIFLSQQKGMNNVVSICNNDFPSRMISYWEKSIKGKRNYHEITSNFCYNMNFTVTNSYYMLPPHCLYSELTEIHQTTKNLKQESLKLYVNINTVRQNIAKYDTKQLQHHSEYDNKELLSNTKIPEKILKDNSFKSLPYDNKVAKPCSTDLKQLCWSRSATHLDLVQTFPYSHLHRWRLLTSPTQYLYFSNTSENVISQINCSRKEIKEECENDECNN